MCYEVVWFADAKDLHEYVREKLWRCQDEKMWRCQGFSCKRQTRYAVEKMWKNTNTHRYADRRSNTDTGRETCLHIYTRRHTRTHTQDWHTHTLAQNRHCEFWCGMHLSCKSTSIKPDRKGMMTRSEKIRNGSLLTDCENRAGSEVTSNGKLRVWVWFDTVWKKIRQGGSRVSHVPLLKIEMIKQVHQGDQPRLPPSCIASLACVCVMAAYPLLKMSK